MTKQKKQIDCRGLACPKPVLMTKEALASSDDNLVVIVDNDGACANVQRFATSQGARVFAETKGGDFYLTIEPGLEGTESDGTGLTCDCDDTGSPNTVVYVSSDVMGRGDDELGKVLMAAFLDTLSHFKGEISHAIFANGGAKLAVEGSPVLAQLQQLEEMGVEVLVCATCLNHFEIKNKLRVGTASNMYVILETLTKAGRILQP